MCNGSALRPDEITVVSGVDVFRGYVGRRGGVRTEGMFGGVAVKGPMPTVSCSRIQATGMPCAPCRAMKCSSALHEAVLWGGKSEWASVLFDRLRNVCYT